MANAKSDDLTDKNISKPIIRTMEDDLRGAIGGFSVQTSLPGGASFKVPKNLPIAPLEPFDSTIKQTSKPVVKQAIMPVDEEEKAEIERVKKAEADTAKIKKEIEETENILKKAQDERIRKEQEKSEQLAKERQKAEEERIKKEKAEAERLRMEKEKVEQARKEKEKLIEARREKEKAEAEINRKEQEKFELVEKEKDTKIKNELAAEIKVEMAAEIEKEREKIDQVKLEMELDIKKEIERAEQIKISKKEEIKKMVAEEVKREIEEEIEKEKAEAEEIKKEVEADIRSELAMEIKKENEIAKEIKKEIGTSMRKEIAQKIEKGKEPEIKKVVIEKIKKEKDEAEKSKQEQGKKEGERLKKEAEEKEKIRKEQEKDEQAKKEKAEKITEAKQLARQIKEEIEEDVKKKIREDLNKKKIVSSEEGITDKEKTEEKAEVDSRLAGNIEFNPAPPVKAEPFNNEAITRQRFYVGLPKPVADIKSKLAPFKSEPLPEIKPQQPVFFSQEEEKEEAPVLDTQPVFQKKASAYFAPSPHPPDKLPEPFMPRDFKFKNSNSDRNPDKLAVKSRAEEFLKEEYMSPETRLSTQSFSPDSTIDKVEIDSGEGSFLKDIISQKQTFNSANSVSSAAPVFTMSEGIKENLQKIDLRKILNYAIIAVALLVVLYGAYYLIKNNFIAPGSISSENPEKEGETFISGTTSVEMKMDLGREAVSSIAAYFKSDAVKKDSGVYKMVLIDKSSGKILEKENFKKALLADFPASSLNALDKNYNLLAFNYPEKNYLRLGLILKITDAQTVTRIFAEWEPAMAKSFEPLFLGDAAAPNFFQGFKANVYKGAVIKYLLFSGKDGAALNYAVDKNKKFLFIATSQEDIYYLIDKINE